MSIERVSAESFCRTIYPQYKWATIKPYDRDTVMFLCMRENFSHSLEIPVTYLLSSICVLLVADALHIRHVRDIEYYGEPE